MVAQARGRHVNCNLKDLAFFCLFVVCCCCCCCWVVFLCVCASEETLPLVTLTADLEDLGLNANKLLVTIIITLTHGKLQKSV